MLIKSSSISTKETHLTSKQLEHWFANIEESTNSSTNDDSYRSEQFLGRFGLKSSEQVIRFLKSREGKVALSLISQALNAIEARHQYQAEQYREERLKEGRHLIFLLMGLVAKEEALAKQVLKITQQQIDQKLKETKKSSLHEKTMNATSLTLSILNANIAAYSRTIKVLDKKLIELNHQLREVDNQLILLQNKSVALHEKHDLLTDHLEELNTFLKVPVFNKRPIEDYIAHTKQQIACLINQLNTLKLQNIVPNPSKQTERKIKVLEQQLAFYEAQLREPPQFDYQIFERRLEYIRERLKEQLCIHNLHPSDSSSYELEGLKLQEKGLLHALQVLRKEKILLNAAFQEVNDFSQAHFIIDPAQRDRYQKRGDCYAICSEEMDPNHLSEEDWLQAQYNYEQLKQDVQIAPVYCHENMCHEIAQHDARKQHYQNLRQEFVTHIEEIKASKVELLQALSHLRNQKKLLAQTETPKSQPKFFPSPRRKDGLGSSYSSRENGREHLDPNQETKDLKKNANPEQNPSSDTTSKHKLKKGYM